MASEKKKTAPKKRAAQAKPTAAEERAQAVMKVLRSVERKMSAKDLKATLGDYVRLIQLSKEMTIEPKTEIKVTWIEEPESPPEE